MSQERRHIDAAWLRLRRQRLFTSRQRYDELTLVEFERLLASLHIASASGTHEIDAVLATLRASAAAWAVTAVADAELHLNPWFRMAAQAADSTVRAACRVLAFGWAALLQHGASFLPIVQHVQGLCRAQAQIQALLREETTALVMSARLLCALPLMSLPLGPLIGANPLVWLAGTTAGRLVLVAGLALQTLSWRVSRSIVNRATRVDADAACVATCAAALAALTARPGAAPLDVTAAASRIAFLDTTGYLARVVESLRSGNRPEQSWLNPAEEFPCWQSVASAVAHMCRTGSVLPQLLMEMADDVSQRQLSDVRTRVRRAGVIMLFPIGLLSLPSFMLLTVVPLVAAHFTQNPWVPQP